MVATGQYNMASDDKDRWTSVFSAGDATNQLMQAIRMASAVMIGLHGLSTCISLYLIIVFRKIAAMPPDMNPLEEDKLTRRKHKHKYKNSEVTLVDEKHLSDFMGTTANSTPNRMSKASESNFSDRNSRKISFTQSRSEQQSLYSPHNPRTAHISRTSLAENVYQQNPPTTSRINLNHEPSDVAYSHRTSPMPNHPKMQKRPTMVSPSQSTDELMARNSREDLAKDNAWFAVGDNTEDGGNNETLDNPYAFGVQSSGTVRHLRPQSQQQINPQQRPSSKPKPTEQPTHDQGESFLHPRDSNHRGNREPLLKNKHSHVPAGHPLHMNPPTPRNNQSPPSPPPQPIAPRRASRGISPSQPGFSHHIVTHSPADDELLTPNQRSKTMTSEVSGLSGSSRYSDQGTESSDLSSAQTGFSTRTAPSRQLYGDLAAAMRGVRHQPIISPRPKSHIGSLHWASSEASYSESTVSHAESKHSRNQSVNNVRKVKSSVSEVDEDEDHTHGSGWRRSGRVVSRSGVDYMHVPSETSRRRDVSGKVAEEGRGGVNSGWFAGGLFRRVSGVPQ